jgi:hypothetical protein
MRKLSKDADYFGRAMFWMMEPADCKGLVFRMVESKPSPRSQAALDELVAAGVVYRENMKPRGVTYKPAIEFKRPGKAPAGEWPVVVPIQAGAT